MDVKMEGQIVQKGDIREFSKDGRTGKVCNAKLKTADGLMSLSLWNEQIDKVSVGDNVAITGYISEFKGVKQFSTGRNGKIEVIKGAPITHFAEPEKDEEDDEERLAEEDLGDLSVAKKESKSSSGNSSWFESDVQRIEDEEEII